MVSDEVFLKLVSVMDRLAQRIGQLEYELSKRDDVKVVKMKVG